MPPAQTPYEGKSVAATEFAYSRHSGLPVDWITRPLRNTFSKQEGILVFQFGLKDASTPELLIQLLRRDIKMKKEANKLKTFLIQRWDSRYRTDRRIQPYRHKSSPYHRDNSSWFPELIAITNKATHVGHQFPTFQEMARAKHLDELLFFQLEEFS